MGKPVYSDQNWQARNVLTQYWGEIAAKPVFFHGIHGGFSGSRVWRVGLPCSKTVFLKKWPTSGPSVSKLSLIHRTLTQLQHFQSLSDIAPLHFAVPIRNSLGESITKADGHLWDLCPEIPGAAKKPAELGSRDLESAMQTVAEIHLALERISKDDPVNWPLSGQLGRSPGLQRRVEWLRRIRTGMRSISQLQAMNTAPLEVRAKCHHLFETAWPHVRESVTIEKWELCSLPIQPCIRDLWYAHILFKKSQVTGIIDFGSIGEDCVVTDLARLLRSWMPQECADFTLALASYQKTRALSEMEVASLAVFDRTSRILSAFQWIEWLAIERRDFEDWEAVSERLDFVLARLPHRN